MRRSKSKENKTPLISQSARGESEEQSPPKEDKDK